MQRFRMIGATAKQLAELERLFPHQGYGQLAGVGPAPAPAPESVKHMAHDRRQIEVVRNDATFDAYDRERLVANTNAGNGRRQIVGAYVDETQGPATFKELGLPLSPIAGVTIAAGASADFELKPNRLFLAAQLTMLDSLAANLLMTTLLIGGENCLLSTGAIPCCAFSHLTVHKPFKAWTASNAQPITFSLKNIHASVSQIVHGVWWGLAQI